MMCICIGKLLSQTFFSAQNQGCRILVGNNASVDSQQDCARIASISSIQTAICRPKVPVRYLSIKQQTSPNLILCEVLVEGYLFTGEHHSFTSHQK